MGDSYSRNAAWALGAALAAVLTQCGGSTFSPGATSDASLDAPANEDAGNDAASEGGPTDSGPVDSGSVDAATNCSPACRTGLTCCRGQCVNTNNDPLNCGACETVCKGAAPFCDGSCKAMPCTSEGGSCGVGKTCCGTDCCDSTQLCCLPEGPLDRGPACQTPTGSPATCGVGCAPLCRSDRNLKRDLESVDPQAVLDAVARMPIGSPAWHKRAEELRDAIRVAGAPASAGMAARLARPSSGALLDAAAEIRLSTPVRVPSTPPHSALKLLVSGVPGPSFLDR